MWITSTLGHDDSTSGQEDQYHVNLSALIVIVIKFAKLSLVRIFCISIIPSFTSHERSGIELINDLFLDERLENAMRSYCHNAKQYYAKLIVIVIKSAKLSLV